MNRRQEESNRAGTDCRSAKEENKRSVVKKLLGKIKDSTEDGLRGLCGRINPDRRVVVIVVVFVLFAALNLWVTFRAIYSIGRDDIRRPAIEIPDTPAPQETGPEEEKSELQQEIEEFFNNNFNSKDDDTADR